MPRSPEQELVDRLGAVEEELSDIWEMCERTGLDTAHVRHTRFGSAGTILGSLLQENYENIRWMRDCAIDLKTEAEEV